MPSVLISLESCVSVKDDQRQVLPSMAWLGSIGLVSKPSRPVSGIYLLADGHQKHVETY